jgi:hypothetical protein
VWSVLQRRKVRRDAGKELGMIVRRWTQIFAEGKSLKARQLRERWASGDWRSPKPGGGFEEDLVGENPRPCPSGASMPPG